MPAFGSNAKFSITKQNSFDGSSAPNSWYKVPFASQDFNFSYDELTDDSIQARYDWSDRVTGIAGTAGTMEANIHPLVTGHFLRGLFGISSSQAVGSGFLHTFNPQTTTFDANVSLPPYALQVDQGEASVTSAYLLSDCFFNTGDISLAAGQYLRGRWGVVGKNATLMTKAPGPDWPTGVKPFVWSSVSLSFGGAASQKFADITFAFNNNIGMQDRIAGSKTHTFYMRDGFREFGRITGTMDVSMTDWLNVKNETEMRVVLFALGVTSISSGVNEYLQIDIPRFVYTAHPLGVSGPGIVTIGVEGRAMYHSGSGTIATITLQNTLSTYG